jgi:hypothetical protein
LHLVFRLFSELKSKKEKDMANSCPMLEEIDNFPLDVLKEITDAAIFNLGPCTLDLKSGPPMFTLWDVLSDVANDDSGNPCLC